MSNKWEKLQGKADDKYNKAQDLFQVHGLDDKRAQELELESSRLQDKVNAAIRRGEW